MGLSQQNKTQGATGVKGRLPGQFKPGKEVFGFHGYTTWFLCVTTSCFVL